MYEHACFLFSFFVTEVVLSFHDSHGVNDLSLGRVLCIHVCMVHTRVHSAYNEINKNVLQF